MLGKIKRTVARYYKGIVSGNSSNIERSDGLDIKFYRNYYSDLRHLSMDRDVADHFIRHGRPEGRFPNADALTDALTAEFGPVPGDFSPSRYRRLNPDLQHLQDRWALEEHYLRHGRIEGRRYGRFDLGVYERAFARLRREELRRKELAPGDPAALPETFAKLLAQARILPGTWLDRFTLYEFAILNARWLARAPRTRIEGLRLFLEQGLDRLAPIALGMTFDPGFYRRPGSGYSTTIPEVDLYRDWLSHGIDNGQPGNEAEALRLLIGEDHFPDCFDPERYRAALPADRPRSGLHRFDLLNHFVASGFPRGIASLRGPGTPRLLGQIGDYHLVRNAPARALEACDAALALAPSDAALLHQRGNALRALGRLAEATRADVAAVGDPGAGIWSHIHAAEGLAAEPDGAEAALDQLLRSAPLHRGDAEWRAAAHRVVARVFEAASAQARALYAEGARPAADTCLTNCLDRLSAVLSQVDPLPARLPPPPGGGLIVLVANRDLPQCDHYRVVQKRAQLEHGGWTVEVFAQDEADRCRPSLDRAAAVIFYRVAAFPPVLHAILYARALGLPTLYEIDDLLFEPSAYPDPFESFEGQITARDYVDLQYGVPLFRYAMHLCDAGLASTPALAEAMRPHLRTGVCHVLRNGFDRRNAPFLARPPVPFADGMLTVFYGSGTKAHNRDFNELAAPALLDVLARHPHVRLLIAGYLTLDARFAPFEDRVIQLGFSANVADYWEVVSGVDINLAVLAGGAMADAKSEIKWLEAAMCGVPSIVSGTRTYREILVPGETALLADTPAEWSGALESLIADAGLRRTIGARARAKAVAEYGLDAAVAVLASTLPAPAEPRTGGRENLERIAPVRVPPVRNRKARILIVNVYFPPQLVGGATRVVRDNLDRFLDVGAERYDFAVLAADAGAGPPYRTRIDAYRGVPVYRVATPQEVNMDWRPLNPEMTPAFADLLDRFAPDLVHLHCVQRLTASVAEALRARGIPYLVTLHDAWWISDFQFLVDHDGQVHAPSPDPLRDHTDPAINPIASLARRRALGRVLDGAEGLLAVSETFAELYRAAGHSRTRTVPNGVPVLTPMPRHSNPAGRVRLGQIGGRTTHKGATLIEAVLRDNAFANLILTLVDHAMPMSEVREEVWGTTPVRLIGRMPQDAIGTLYAGLDVLLAPSLWPESFGLVTREAQAAGLWVVASDRGAIGADILEGVDGFRIDVGTAEGLRAVLARIDADPDRFRSSPPQAARSTRSANDQGDDLLALYETLLTR